MLYNICFTKFEDFLYTSAYNVLYNIKTKAIQYRDFFMRSGMILFGPLFFQFVSGLVRDNVLSTIEFNAV